MERIYLTSEDRIELFENNLVTVTLADGRTFEELEPRRLFPVNMPEKYITLLDKDGVEQCVIRDTGELNSSSSDIIRKSLNDYYLVPEILRIVNVSDKYGILRWEVDTDRGRKSFDIRNRNHDIRVSGDCSIRVRDSDDNRYVIKDYRLLDSKSRKFLNPEL
jgi:hypothetical protein